MFRFLIIVWVVLSGLAAAEEDVGFVFRFGDAVLLSKTVEPYTRMHIVLNGDGASEQGFDRFGRMETYTFSHSPSGDFGAYKRQLRRTLLQRFGLDEKTEDTQRFFLLSDDPQRWLYLDVLRDKYSVKYLEAGSYAPCVSLDASSAYRYSERLSQRDWKLPANKLVPHISGFVISDAAYKRRDVFRFDLNDGQRRVEGELWQLKYEWHDGADKEVRRYAVLHHYRDLVRALGAKILLEDLSHIVFHIGGEEEGTWGVFGCNDIAASLVLVRQSQAATETILDINALKKALDGSGHVALKGIYFDTGEATLKPESGTALAAAAGLMRRFPDINLTVEGHTDNVGEPAMNKTLSLRRAEAVKAAIVSMGIAADRLVAEGYGEERPIASNSDEKGRAENRRVELRQVSKGGRSVGIDASFFQPMRDAKMTEQRKEPYDSLDIPAASPEGSAEKRPTEKTVKGDASTVRYILLKDGKRDRTVSGYEIVSVFKKNIAALGGSILFATDDMAYFIIPKGAGDTDVYGTIDAAMGAYRIYTIQAEEVILPSDDNKSKKSTKVHAIE